MLPVYMPLYSMIMTLMVGVMLGLVVWSSRISSQRGIIEMPESHYDYIIVGGGTAGCVLAARLSANPYHSVLLVEAGEYFNWLSSVPLVTPMLQGSAHDWAYHTKSQVHSSWGLNNQSSACPRGRGLGGTGQMNYMLHYTGSEEDFSRWEDSGATGWGLRQLQPYVSKMLGTEYQCIAKQPYCLNSYQILLMSAAGLHTTSLHQKSQNNCKRVKAQPRMHISHVDVGNSVLGKAFIDAGNELAMAFKGLSFSTVQSTVYKGQRWSSLDGYLRPTLGQHNLKVLLNTRVTKVVFDNARVVQGVELRMSGDLSTKFVRSRKEVVLSAGAINTPHILLQSGVGPQAHLHKYGIPVVSDLNVGFNLHDHLNMPLYVSLETPVSVTINKVQQVHQFWDYMIHGKGLLASSGLVGVGTAETDLGLLLFGFGSTDEKIFRDIANYKQETFHALFPFSHNKTQEGFVLLASCLLPSSRGIVTLNDADPSNEPVIDPQYLQHPHDIACMIRAVKLAISLSSSQPFQHLGAKLHLPQLEECQHLEVDPQNQSYLECIIRTAAITGYHPGGTCKMGSPHDKTTVVDPQLRVRGLHGLRVMDASVMPTPVSGHPNSILIAMADRTADLILRH
ncbi:neither inactivation nor afterpotential protein G isoform X3 [Zootermopsis nevadensis]|uniref:neither inactivation nor afterpotential protein G isoform X3 n=1 Tax=Zootermopsis nevadensis TaxID=136037 RepID=UPI000B8E816A|nr:neither inactivation nor afterpotential protein G isoform X3 [Zootermopsis nevadensis]XP_021937880.1 neither inactivation nor afterpotential protein G isoform X3 [Zootermopsis nevadensis]